MTASTMPLQLTALTAAVLAILMLVLTVRVIMKRSNLGQSILDGGNMSLAEDIRRHGNFAEQVPMALILMGFVEAMSPSSWLVIAIGGCLVAGRVLHPIGLSHANPTAPLRIAGQSLTMLSIGLSAGSILVLRSGLI